MTGKTTSIFPFWSALTIYWLLTGTLLIAAQRAYLEYPVAEEDQLGHSGAAPVHLSGFIC
jgi:hypothetical protein